MAANMTEQTAADCIAEDEQDFLSQYYFNMFANTSVPDIRDHERRIEAIIKVFEYCSTVLCVLGVMGNVLNILVLSQKSILVSMERMERSAHCGLLALALSDLMYCILYLPKLWVAHSTEYRSRSFSLYYVTYSDGFVNTFLLSSTWLTVTMATSRYLAICFPLRARQVIGMTFAKISIVFVFVVCILFNIPRYFTWSIQTDNEVYCHSTVYRKIEGPLLNYKTAGLSYRWIYFVTGILIPLLILAYCNVKLVRALQRSSRMQVSLRASRPRTIQTTNRITLIFIIIIILYLVMVMPGELVHFARDIAARSGQGHIFYNLTLAITNTCQAFNFTINFVLYMVLNAHFRSHLCMLAHCACLHRKHGDKLYHAATTRQVELSNTDHLDGVTMTTTAPSPKNSMSFV